MMMNAKNTSGRDRNKRSFIETARRAQIIECAIDAIAELGVAQASLAQIAKRANVSTGMILYYFRSKDELMREVLIHASAAVGTFVTERLHRATPTTTLLSYIDAHIRAAAEKQMLAITNINQADYTAGGAPKVDRRPVEPRTERLWKILEWGQETGEFRRFDVAAMICAITAIIDAIPSQRLIEPDIDIDAYRKELVDLFDRAIRADAAPGSASGSASGSPAP